MKAERALSAVAGAAMGTLALLFPDTGETARPLPDPSIWNTAAPNKTPGEGERNALTSLNKAVTAALKTIRAAQKKAQDMLAEKKATEKKDGQKTSFNDATHLYSILIGLNKSMEPDKREAEKALVLELTKKLPAISQALSELQTAQESIQGPFQIGKGDPDIHKRATATETMIRDLFKFQLQLKSLKADEKVSNAITRWELEYMFSQARKTQEVDVSVLNQQ